MIYVQWSFSKSARGSDWLKVDFWIQGPWKSFHCAMYLLPLDLVSQNQLSTNQNLTHTEWPLDMYHSVGHVSPCIVFHCYVGAQCSMSCCTEVSCPGHWTWCSSQSQYPTSPSKPSKEQLIWAASWQNQQNACAPSKNSDQTGHPPSLIRIFAVHMKKHWALTTHWVRSEDSNQTGWMHSHFVGLGMRRLIWTNGLLHLKSMLYLWANQPGQSLPFVAFMQLNALEEI